MKSENNEVVVVLVTFPTLEQARQIGTHLVENQLIACINLVPGMESIYSWKGKIEQEQEILGIIKTSRASLDDLQKIYLDMHPYDVPELLIIKDISGLPGYLDWVEQSCSIKQNHKNS